MVFSTAAMAQSTIKQNQRAFGSRVEDIDGSSESKDRRALKRIDTRLDTRLRTRIDPIHGTQTNYAAAYTPKIDTQTSRPAPYTSKANTQPKSKP
ncbi:MAG: hypothetical protein ABIS14_11945 [Sphingomonas sp.]